VSGAPRSFYDGPVTVIVPDSPRLRRALEELADDRKADLRTKRHPWIGPGRMLILQGLTWAGDELVRDLAEQFGKCRWSRGRWEVERVQLSFRGFA
jgi:hypothetical protein